MAVRRRRVRLPGAPCISRTVRPARGALCLSQAVQPARGALCVSQLGNTACTRSAVREAGVGLFLRQRRARLLNDHIMRAALMNADRRSHRQARRAL